MRTAEYFSKLVQSDVLCFPLFEIHHPSLPSGWHEVSFAKPSVGIACSKAPHWDREANAWAFYLPNGSRRLTTDRELIEMIRDRHNPQLTLNLE